MLAPIVLFIYNRPDHTQKVIDALRQNTLAKQSILYVFADGPKETATSEQKTRIEETRRIASRVIGFQKVHLMFSEKNKGCAKSIIDGVTYVVNKHGRVIVVEDDIVTIPQFLQYMNDALNVYDKDHRIWAVGGMNMDVQLPQKYTTKHDVYLVRRSCSWGWATWRTRWRDIDWEVRDADKFFSDPKAMRRFDRGGDGMAQMLKDQLDSKIDAWDIVWDYHIYKHNGYCIYPVRSFTYNVGLDGSGTHYVTGKEADAQAPLFNPEKDQLRLEPHLRPNREVQRIFYNYWGDNPKLSFTTTVKRRIKKALRKMGIMKQPQ